MKLIKLVITVLLITAAALLAQESTIIAGSSEAAEGLDLHAVSELFKESENLEEFEKALNNADNGVNNLDLDDNGEVDYIRIVEEVAEETHVIILQVPLGQDEYQDVATIAVEQTGDDAYNMQVHGNEVFYGPDYYVAPVNVRIYSWPIIGWMYRPYYRPYRSVYVWGSYPRWWKPWRPVSHVVYRSRTVHYSRRPTFRVTRVNHVHTVHKVNYKPRSSVVVKKKTYVAKPAGGKTRVRSTTTVTGTGRRGNSVQAKKSVTAKRGTVTSKKSVSAKKGNVTAKRSVSKSAVKKNNAGAAKVTKKTAVRKKK